MELKTEFNLSQSEIASLVSKKANVNFYSKDVNALNNLQNKSKWKGQSKQEKIESFYQALLLVLDDFQSYSIIDISDKEIISLVESAIAAEFNAYKALPDIDESLSLISPFFTSNGSATKRIKGILDRNKKRNWVLTDEFNPSTYKLFDAKIVGFNDEQKIVETKEYWLLIWFNTLTKESDFIYEKNNSQTYILIKDENTGKYQIDVNSYVPSEKRIIPKVFSTDEFKHHLEKNSEDIAKEVRQIIAKGGVETAIQILHDYLDHIPLPELQKKATVLQSSLSDYTRALNVDIMSKNDYFKAKSEVVKELLELIEKFEAV